MRRVGVLMNGSATGALTQAYVKTIAETLRAAGWIEGKNISIDVRYNAGDAALARIFAAQLIGLMPDVFLAASTTNLTIVRELTNTVPIVFIGVSDPVEQGFVSNYAKPGGNITGFTAFEFSIGGKWLELLKTIAPDLARIAVMFNPDTSPQSSFFMRSIGAAGASLGIAVAATPVRTTAEIEPTIVNFARHPNGGLILPTDTFTQLRSKLIADLANSHGLPSLGTIPQYVRDGGLVFYGFTNQQDTRYQQAANYVDRILKGEKPGDLPVQSPTIYNLIVNLRTAKVLGLSVPPPLLSLAEEVIQ
jgi:putative ABC transport system substrate-binding protein